MSTLGNVFFSDRRGNITFKQCDIDVKREFYSPVIEYGRDGIKYMTFGREGLKGPWAGVNNYGVSFVSVDSYLGYDNSGVVSLNKVDSDIYLVYKKILSDTKTAQEAAEYMKGFYKSFNRPDMLLITDAKKSYFIETNNNEVECIERRDGFFASTNHFRMLNRGVLYPLNHSTYLRLSRAEAILLSNEGVESVYKVLRDQYFGESVFSICRVNGETPHKEESCFTQASVLFFSEGDIVNCVYQLNGNPMSNNYTVVQDVFGAHSVSRVLIESELYKKSVQTELMTERWF